VETPVINLNLTSLAVILWSGFLIVAGAILILSSQVRHLVDVLESRPTGVTGSSNGAADPPRRDRARAGAATSAPRVARNAGPRATSRADRRNGAPARPAL
jgi:hypothetical protein